MNEQLEVPAPRRTDTKMTPVRRRRPWLSWLLALLVVLGVCYVGWRLLGRHTAPAAAGRQGAGAAPQPVGTATVATGDVDVVLTGLGAVTPLANVTVKTQINGQLQQVGFTEGQMVHKGDFLAQIDPRPYQVQLEQAQGTLAKDSALLAQSKADNARFQTLSRQDSISRQQVEDQVFLVKQYEGAIITDQAAIDSAKLNLAYCRIVSPVDGRVGLRVVDAGNYVQTGDTGGLVVVTQLQPISVLFTVPEDEIGLIQQQMAAGPLSVDAYDRTNTTRIATGTLATTDNQVDPSTGTVKLRAVFPNTDNSLFPQQFVNARLLAQTLKGVVVAPQAAIQTGAPGTFVYLVKPGGTVAVQVIKTGISNGDRVQVTDGLQAGDVVVTDGLDRLRDGAKVTVAQPGVQPGVQPGGKPAAGPASSTASPAAGRRGTSAPAGN